MARVYEVGNESNYAETPGLVMLIECDLTPPPIAIGKIEYYFNRFENFIERHPDCEHTPPDYYYGVLVNVDEEIDTEDLKELVDDTKLPIYERADGKKKPDPTQSYGHKYCTKFSKLKPELSADGQQWLDATLYDLQDYMELGVVDKAYVSKYNHNFNIENKLNNKHNLEHFYTDIELDNDKFRSFAFATHPDAYDPPAMQKLPMQDLLRILSTPELKEWGEWDTWEQAWIMACEIIPNELETWQITEATWEKLKKDYPNATRIITDSQKLLNEKLNELKSHWEQFSL